MGRCILIIDEDEMALLVRRMVLEDAGYAVIGATNAEVALRFFATHPVDLVITDGVTVPQSHRLLSAELRRLSPELPVLILSGSDAPPPEYVNPPDYFLHKLEGPAEMIAKVRSALGAHA